LSVLYNTAVLASFVVLLFLFHKAVSSAAAKKAKLQLRKTQRSKGPESRRELKGNRFRISGSGPQISRASGPSVATPAASGEATAGGLTPIGPADTSLRFSEAESLAYQARVASLTLPPGTKLVQLPDSPFRVSNDSTFLPPSHESAESTTNAPLRVSRSFKLASRPCLNMLKEVDVKAAPATLHVLSAAAPASPDLAGFKLKDSQAT
jgi:hypothetical protein